MSFGGGFVDQVERIVRGMLSRQSEASKVGRATGETEKLTGVRHGEFEKPRVVKGESLAHVDSPNLMPSAHSDFDIYPVGQYSHRPEPNYQIKARGRHNWLSYTPLYSGQTGSTPRTPTATKSYTAPETLTSYPVGTTGQRTRVRKQTSPPSWKTCAGAVARNAAPLKA